MAKDVKPTRKNLMQIEDRIELSERGHDTLEKKRDGLVVSFRPILDIGWDLLGTLPKSELNRVDEELIEKYYPEEEAEAEEAEEVAAD